MIGIYLIKNIISGKVYIGSSLNIKERWKGHRVLLKRNKHHSPHLQAAYNKYGKDVFIFGIIEECNSDNLQEREQHWLDFYKSYIRKYGYNISKFANSALAAKQLFSGKKQSEEHKLKNSLAKRGAKNPNFGKIYTEEERKKHSDANHKRYLLKPVKIFNFTSPCGTNFTIKNLSKFCRIMKLQASSMSLLHNEKQKHHKGWKKTFL